MTRNAATPEPIADAGPVATPSKAALDAGQDAPSAGRALWLKAVAEASAHEPRAAERSFAKWRNAHAAKHEYPLRYLQSFYLTAKAYAASLRAEDAIRLRDEVIAAWQEVGSPKGGRAASMAAEMAFLRAEHRRQDFDRYAIPKPPPTAQTAAATLDKLDELATQAQSSYRALDAYEVPVWMAAARVRIGDVDWCQAEKLVAVPMPPGLAQRGPRIRKQYRGAVEQLVEPLQKRARESWRKAGELAPGTRWADRATSRARHPPACG